MEKVLIVEDEILARLGLRQLLDWERLGFCLLPDARDGEEALRSIRENRPEYVLLDLNIPKVNGLEILEYLRREKLECRVIVISCNEEFQTVKEAMKLGAYDYLRKLNLSSEELLEILEKSRREPGQEAGALPAFPFHEVYYEEMIGGSGRDIFAEVGTYRTLLCILPQTAGSQDTVYRAAEVTKQWLGEQKQDGLRIIKGMQCCYFAFERQYPDEFYRELHRRLGQCFQERVYMGIREAVMGNEEEISDALAVAEQVGTFSYYDEEQEIQRLNRRLDFREHMPKGMPDLLNRLKLVVSEFQQEQSNQCIRDIFRNIHEEKYVYINVLRRIFMDMLGIYSMTAQSLNGAIEEIEVEQDNCHYQRLMMMNSLSGIERWFLAFEEQFFQKFFVEFKCGRSELLKSVFEYLRGHLQEPVHLSEAAREIGVSGAYLSTVFKKEMGRNFIEYVNMEKVRLARQMLEEGRMVYEVSDTLGFENSTYFSRVFKKYAGLSPDAYRREKL